MFPAPSRNNLRYGRLDATPEGDRAGGPRAATRKSHRASAEGGTNNEISQKGGKLSRRGQRLRWRARY